MISNFTDTENKKKTLSICQGTGVVCFSFFFWLRVLDKAEYSAFESTLNSPIVSYCMSATQYNLYTQTCQLSDSDIALDQTESYFLSLTGF